MDQAFFDAQALRLLRAFFKVRDPNARNTIVELAEAAERGASIGGTVDGSVGNFGADDGKVVDLPTLRNSAK